MTEEAYHPDVNSFVAPRVLSVSDTTKHLTEEDVLLLYEQHGFFEIGERYIKGEWQCKNLDNVLYRIFNEDRFSRSKVPWKTYLVYGMRELFTNPQGKRRAFNIGEEHYDLGNDLFEAMLDTSMTYTSGYWQNAESLDQAQEAKLDRMCSLLDLKPDMHVLDIGCGWGNFAYHAAKKHGVRVTGVTVSKEQAALARERCTGLPVEIKLKDYREVNQQFDHIVSIEMIEAVGRQNIPVFFDVVHRCLKERGKFMLQVISEESFSLKSDQRLDQLLLWLMKNIFPDGYIPNIRQLTEPTRSKFKIEDLQNFGQDYDKTLVVWLANFKKNWPKLSSRYDERFRRMWTFYLSACAAVFRAQRVQLYQILYSKSA